MNANMPIITSITAIVIAVIGIVGSVLAYQLGKKRLGLETRIYDNGKSDRNISNIKIFSDAAESAVETAEKSMAMNQSLQDEIIRLKGEINKTIDKYIAQADLLTKRIIIVEGKLRTATDEITILLDERTAWMETAKILHMQLVDANIVPFQELPYRYD